LNDIPGFRGIGLFELSQVWCQDYFVIKQCW